MVTAQRCIFAGGVLLTILLCTGFVSTDGAHADIIKFKDGRQMEGKVVEETPSKVTIKLKFGVQIFKRSEIASITKQKTESDEYDERLKGLRSKDAEGHYQLGVWALRKGMKTKAKRLFQKTIRLDTNHTGARTELGFKRVDDDWLPVAEANKILADREVSSLRDRGFVMHDGEWRSPEDMEKIRMGLVPFSGGWITKEELKLREDGYVRYKNRWVTKEEKTMRSRGFDFYQGKWVNKTELLNMRRDWVDAWEATTPHYKIKTNINEEFCDDVANMMEQAYVAYFKVVGAEPKDNSKAGVKSKSARRMAINILSTREEYRHYCRTNRLEKNADLDGFYNARKNLIATWSGNNLDFIRRFIVSLGIWQYYYNSVGNGLPSWLSEGLAAYFNACHWDGEKLTVGLSDTAVIKFIFNLREKGRLFEPNVLITEDLHEIIQRGDFKRFSAQAYGLTYYILKGPDEKVRTQFFQFLETVKRAPFVLGNTDILGADMLRKAFGGRSEIVRVHDEGLEFLSQIGIASKKKAIEFPASRFVDDDD